MFQTFMIWLALFSSLCCSVNSNNFCKLVEKEFSLRSMPYTYQCGRSMCSRNEKECNKYLKAGKEHKTNQMYEFIQSVTLLNLIRNSSDIKQDGKFRQFQSQIKDCSKSCYCTACHQIRNL